MANGELIYKEESYKIIGSAFRVANDLGYGLREFVYQQAFSRELEKAGLKFEREKVVDILYDSQKLGKYRLDFVINDKIVVELKVRPSLGYPHIKQVTGYLRSGNYKLAILIYFTRDGVKYRRILNPSFGSRRDAYIRADSPIREHSYG